MRVDGKRVDLSAEQYDALMQSSGKPAKMYLDQQVQTPVWRSMEYDHRAGFIKQTMEDFRAAGREALKRRCPKLDAANDGAPPLPPGFAMAN